MEECRRHVCGGELRIPLPDVHNARTKERESKQVGKVRRVCYRLSLFSQCWAILFVSSSGMLGLLTEQGPFRPTRFGTLGSVEQVVIVREARALCFGGNQKKYKKDQDCHHGHATLTQVLRIRHGADTDIPFPRVLVSPSQ